MNLPSSCIVDSFVAKNKIYSHANLSESVKNTFINDLKKIIWSYKLSQDTIKISKTDNVAEIEIFTLFLNNRVIPNSVLRVINKIIPYKILFKLVYNDDYCYAVVENDTIYNSEWNEIVDFQFNGLNLESVWNNIIKRIIREEDNYNLSIDEILDNKNRIDLLKREIEQLESKIRHEQQFNRKVELNQLLRNKKLELEELINE